MHRSNLVYFVAGFTLLELMMVISILGILAAAVAIFMRDPVKSYIDTERRSELSDIANTAIRRMARDIHIALPNSLRVTQAVATYYLELLPTKNGGRYRSQQDNASAGNVLNFSAADASFDTLGPLSALTGQTIAANDVLVVHNLFSAPAQTESNAYTYLQVAGALNCTVATPTSSFCNTARITGVDVAGALANERTISFDSRQFPLSSPSNRFHILPSNPGVTYVCAPGAVDAKGNGTGTLTRWSNYAVTIAQPVAQPGGSTSGVLATNVTACTITYDQVVLTQNHGLVSIQLTLTRGNETISLYQEIHVSNVP